MRFITLSEKEQILVNKLEKESPNHITRLRCNLLKLSHKKLSMKEVSRLTDIKWLRIVEFFNAWENAETLSEKQKTLYIKEGRGAKVKLDPVKEILPGLIKENSRNLKVILSILSEKHQINVSKVTLQNFLKETNL
ncbi:hypothetical protein LNP80_13590 [Chryseobacterium sp. C-39]|uniref:Uncharacterized protein n=2 Tax=Chryseobacterium muglaense TaxID=2893752 RepID=A0A9Q3UV02_9FLAO|nr:hypothetical protein [Chryseobacterium muglaense]MCC9033008.1 hypothetical protein [Chryseobacterium muglaense]MCC9033515.1 hypothetical protein [Chryseobacterium muglaense]MCC9033980.1 hypothetical protein [Chryseobacterium muglaense]MCC9035281.1 hypothetical protein [Chryseobacterium muglaense]